MIVSGDLCAWLRTSNLGLLLPGRLGGYSRKQRAGWLLRQPSGPSYYNDKPILRAQIVVATATTLHLDFRNEHPSCLQRLEFRLMCTEERYVLPYNRPVTCRFPT